MGTRREKLAKWVKSLSTVQKIVIGIIVAFVAIAILYQFEWSGFGKDENKSETTKVLINPKTGEILLNPETGKIITFTETTTKHESAKTLWDWFGLAGTIAIPFALFYFERREQRRSEKRSQELEEQTYREKEIAEENAKREKEIVDNNLREQTLEAYIDRISDLLIDKDLGLLIRGLYVREGRHGDLSYIHIDENSHVENSKRDAVLDIVRARTLSVLRSLNGDGERKESVIKFLDETDLISYLDFEDADLRNAKNLSSVMKAKNWKLAKYDDEAWFITR